MEKVTFYGEIEGISLEQMVRYGKFDMRVKHFHNQYEIFYIIEGERLFFFNNREYVARSGDLILVDSNLIHMTKSVTAEDTGHNRVILYVSYDRMKAFDGQYDRPTIDRWLTEFLRRFFISQFKRSCIPDSPKVGSVSLSPRGDWRMPSDAAMQAFLQPDERI